MPARSSKKKRLTPAATKRASVPARARLPRADAQNALGLAGGLEAYRAFFDAMPPNTGMAFVLVQHLDPDHASALVEILRNNSKMEVSHAESGVAIVANHVFTIPPDAIMKIKGGVLQLTRPASAVERRVATECAASDIEPPPIVVLKLVGTGVGTLQGVAGNS